MLRKCMHCSSAHMKSMTRRWRWRRNRQKETLRRRQDLTRQQKSCWQQMHYNIFSQPQSDHHSNLVSKNLIIRWFLATLVISQPMGTSSQYFTPSYIPFTVPYTSRLTMSISQHPWNDCFGGTPRLLWYFRCPWVSLCYSFQCY